MSAPEATTLPPLATRLRPVEADIVELAVLRGASVPAGAPTLPPPGGTRFADGVLLVAVRPGRALWLAPADAPGATAARLATRLAGSVAVIDQSSGYLALELTGAAARDLLARGCRLDLDPAAFCAGRAAATTIAQVGVVLAATARGFLLLVPSTYGRHFTEWLLATGRPFALGQAPAVPFHVLAGDPDR